MNPVDLSSRNRIPVTGDDIAGARLIEASPSANANSASDTARPNAEHVDSPIAQPDERWGRVKRALAEPQWMSGESYQDYLARRERLGFMPPAEAPSPSGWTIAGEILLSLLWGGPGIGIGRPVPARALGRPVFSYSPRPTSSSETMPLLRPNPRTSPQVEPQPVRATPFEPVRPPLEPVASDGVPVEAGSAEITESGESLRTPKAVVAGAPESLTPDAWKRQSKDGLNEELVQKIDDAFEDGQDVRVHTSKSGTKTYLIHDPDDRAYFSIDSNETWYPTEMYDYKAIGTWETGKPNQKYAPIEQFDRGRDDVIQTRSDSAKTAMENGVHLDPVKVNEVAPGSATRFRIVDGNHRHFAAQQLGLSTIPYEIVN
ncbi:MULTISPECIES: ParB/Srx family N-terminal domain-containing protein [Burkholderia]|nr:MULTISPECIES: ParB/Srx family N-terminal domain-containing protein [Burkholderia]